jgi:Skp family chaperone for outer membrane proteins
MISLGGHMNIRKFVAAAAIFLMIAAFGTPDGFCADIAKIGTVNFEKIFNNSTAGKAARTQIKAEGQRMNADLEKIQSEIKELQQYPEPRRQCGGDECVGPGKQAVGIEPQN